MTSVIGVADIRRELYNLSRQLNENVIPHKEIQKIAMMAHTGKPSYKGLGATLPQYMRYIQIEDGSKPLDSDNQKSLMSLVIGGRYSTKTNVIGSNIPFFVAGMSFGSLKLPMKIAIHLAANRLFEEHNISLIVNTGEGGALPWELYGRDEHKEGLTKQELKEKYEYAKKFLEDHQIKLENLLGAYKTNYDSFIEKILFQRHYPLIVQVASGRFWRDPNYLLNPEGIEIKIGQGAKIGHGGLLPGIKVYEHIAEIRGIPPWKDARSPARQLHILGPEDLTAYVSELREITRWKVPIIVKIGASDVYYDTTIILKSGADAGAIDGLTGGTGAAPDKVQHVIGISTEPAIIEAKRAIRDYYNEHRDQKQNFKLLAMGGLFDYEHILKALLLGADGVGQGTSFLLATDCTLIMNCNTNICPAGITGSPEKFDIVRSTSQIVNYVIGTAEKLKKVTAHNPTIDDLVTDNKFVSAALGIKLRDGRTYEGYVSANADEIVKQFLQAIPENA